MYKFNLIRAIAVLLVVFGHYLCHYHNYETSTNLLSYFKIHVIGMGLFFSLSGFLIFKSAAASTSMICFIKRRIFRITPCIVALSTAALLSNGKLMYFLETITLTGDLFGHFNIYGIDFWSLHTEFRFYILVLLGFLVFKNKFAAFWFIALAWLTTTVLLSLLNIKTTFSAPLWNMFSINYILFGILTYFYHEAFISKMKFLALYVSLYVATTAIKLQIFSNFSVSSLSLNAFTPDCYQIGVLISSIVILRKKSFNVNKAINHVANISYPLYLTHHVLIVKFGFIGILIAIAVSEILHFFVEKPFIEYSKTSKLSFPFFRKISY